MDANPTQQVLIEYANEVLQLRLQVAQLRAELAGAKTDEGGEDGATEREG